MTVKGHSIEIQCDLTTVTDVAKILVHSIVFFRTFGKFTFIQEASYSIGTLGAEEVDCKHLELTYMRCSSDTLVKRIDTKLEEFVKNLDETSVFAILKLDFYTKQTSRWPFNDSRVIWESWNLKLSLNYHHHLHHHQLHQPTHHYNGSSNQHQQQPKPLLMLNHQQRAATTRSLEDNLRQKLIDIVTIVNSQRFSSTPRMPTQSNLDETFDSSYPDLQPYLYSLSYKISDSLEPRRNLSNATTATTANVGAGTATANGGGGGGGGELVEILSDNYVHNNEPRRSSLQRFFLGTLEL